MPSNSARASGIELLAPSTSKLQFQGFTHKRTTLNFKVVEKLNDF
jgi:hypothetical protein